MRRAWNVWATWLLILLASPAAAGQGTSGAVTIENVGSFEVVGVDTEGGEEIGHRVGIRRYGVVGAPCKEHEGQ